MHPILFEIPGLGFPVRAFGVTVAAGIFLGIWVWGRLLSRYGDDPSKDPERGSSVAVWIVVGIILGARLMYAAVESSRYLGADLNEEAQLYLESEDRGRLAATIQAESLEAAREVIVGYEFTHDPLKLILIWEGGLVMYGGMIGGILLALYQFRKQGMRVWNSLDTGMISSFVGLAVGRWGCFLVGDDYGKVVTGENAEPGFPPTLTVPDAEWLRANPESLFGAELAGQTLWATQIFMSVNALIVAFVGYQVLKRRSWFGQASAVMVIHYSITRYIIENFRGDKIRGVWFDGALSTSQLISVVGLLIGLLLLVKKPGPKVSASPE